MLKIDMIANPTVGDMSCVPGVFTNHGNPILTGRSAHDGNDKFLEVEFTEKLFWRKERKIITFIHKDCIKHSNFVIDQ